MKISFFDYIWKAFNAKPIGMFVAPNHIAAAGIGLLGFLNPGFWVLGLGLELAYLYVLSTNERFRHFVKGEMLQQTRTDWSSSLTTLLAQLPPEEQTVYRQLETRCRSILAKQGTQSPTGLAAQEEGLARLLWIYLRLLLARQAILRMRGESDAGENSRKNLDKRLAGLRERVQAPDLNVELRKSLNGQIEILQQRLLKRGEAEEKLAYLEAELSRIQDQVELIREQATLCTDPAVVSQRIDDISASLGGTSEWMSQQQQFFGAIEDTLTEPPPLLAAMESKS